MVVFDLDGVLVDTRHLHFEALNDALAQYSEKFTISEHEHSFIYDGLDTFTKLSELTKRKGLNPDFHEEIWALKQRFTQDRLNNVQVSKYILDILKSLKKREFRIGVASNSIRSTLDKCLDQLGIAELIDFSLSNEDVQNPKPHPEIYWRSMMLANSHPSSTVILEDSALGRAAAVSSGSKVLPVKKVEGFYLDEILSRVGSTSSNKGLLWEDMELNVLIPMAGQGSRFRDAGFTFPKPLIEVHGKPMIQLVVENLAVKANFIYLVQKSDAMTYNLHQLLKTITPGTVEVLEVDGQTEGAAVTALKAIDLIDNSTPLLIANSDQYLEWDALPGIQSLYREGLDVGVLTFDSTHPKWSFVEKDETTGLVSRVEEKNPISSEATCGIYFWKQGRDFVRSAQRMIDLDIRTNGEFYIAPSINQLIEEGARVGTLRIERMWGLGTPEDLEYFHKHFPKEGLGG